MSISTGRGDGGDTGFVDGTRASKDDPRVEAYGTVDELNATLALVRNASSDAPFEPEIAEISSLLFDMGCDLATPGAGLEEGAELRLHAGAIERLGGWIRREESELPPLRTFVLPGGTPAAAALHLARTVCRRAERRVVTLRDQTREGEQAIVFLNRLSDLLFLYARRANALAGVEDVPWKPAK